MITRLALTLGLLLAASQASPIATSDAPGWTEQRMPWLGYAVDLPTAWERVTGDLNAPVPSIDLIAQADPNTAQDLATVAQQLQTGGGLFDALGFWAVDPASLMQLGLLAGSPYRVPAAALESGVQESVANRASELQELSIEPIALPAGEGFLAVYLDANDLSEHREVHLRTPAGRYLILASTYPGVADASLQSVFRQIAESIRPLPGAESGERPAPSAGTEGRAHPELEDALPTQVGDVTLTRHSLNGESLVGGGITGAGTVAGELGSLVAAPGDVAVAIAVPDDDTQLLIAAFRLSGVDEAGVADFLANLPSEVWSPVDIDGRSVLASVVAEDGSRTWLLTGESAGDTVLVQVESNDLALGEAAVRALP
jgi:hypothetical protein